MVAACAAALVLAGCALTPAAAPQLRPHATASPHATHTVAWSVVALGDSVPAGGGCGCTPFPQLSASRLSVHHVRDVTATNDAVNGATSTDVLDAVTTDHRVESDLSGADIVEIEVGANDVEFSAACGTTVSCYQEALPAVEQNLRDIVGQVQALTQARGALVVLLDYWNVWLGGSYAQAQGPAYVAAATTLTDQVDTLVREVAADTGSAYVDLRAAFEGPDYSGDETRLLAPDGDHPNAQGHARIAQPVVDAVASRLDL